MGVWRAAAAAASLSLAAGGAWAQAKVETLVPGSAFHGVHGVRFSPAGELYAGSVAGQSLYKVDLAAGTAEVAVGPPHGMADDIAFGPGGQMVWTAILEGVVYSRRGDGPVEALARDLPSVNSIAFSRDGRRLFAAQVFGGDALWELDPAGVKPPRLIHGEPLGGFNSFAAGPDGWLYGPLWFKGQVVKIHPDTGELKVVAEELDTPAAAKFGAKDDLYVLDTALGEVVRVDIATGAKARVAQLASALDNLAVAPDGKLVVSNMADNGLQVVDPATGAVRQVMKGALAFPADLALSEDGETLYVADVFAYRAVDAAGGAVRDIARVHTRGSKLEYPTGVSVGPDRVVLASSPAGAVLVYDRRTGQALEVLHGFNAPSDALELVEGELLVAEMGGGDLLRVRGETRTKVASGLAAPASLAAGPGNSVYMAEVAGGRVSRVDLGSGARTTIVENLKLPKAVAVGPDGRLFVLELGERRVISVDPASGAVSTVAGDLPVGLVIQPVPLAGGIAVSASGVVYVTSDVENSILRIAP